MARDNSGYRFRIFRYGGRGTLNSRWCAVQDCVLSTEYETSTLYCLPVSGPIA